MPPLFWLDITALSISMVITTSLVLIVLGTGPRRALNRSFALFALMEALWIVSALLLRLSLWLEPVLPAGPVIGNSLLWLEMTALSIGLMSYFLLRFTVLYLGCRSRRTDLALALGLLLVAVFSVPLFRHQVVLNPRLDANGMVVEDINAWGGVVVAILIASFLWSLILFWQERRRTGELYLALSVLILLVGIVMGGIFDVPFPSMSITNALSAAILGYGVISRQLFNPLRERTAELQREITERKRAEEALRESEALLSKSQAIAHIGSWELDLVANRLTWSDEVYRMFGLRPQEFDANYEAFLDTVHPDDRAAVDAAYSESLREGRDTYEIEHRIVRQDSGEVRVVHEKCEHMKDTSGRIVRSVGMVQDITERKQLEAQLRQAQKMEAIGQLVAGIAHDFNNLLTPIGGFAALLLGKAPEGSQQQEHLCQIKVAAERAIALTRQLRLFTRQEKGERRPVQLKRVVEETRDLLERSIPKEIAIRVSLEPELRAVKADPSQISQVLMNLCLNARDAMPDGGTLTLETRNVTLDEEYAQTVLEVQPGRYVRLSVSDTGCGMSPEVQARLFEPFFTTKEVGKGTGLGLSVVYGIIKGHGGFIQVYSEEGRGSTFHVYLPAIELAVEEREGVEELELPTGTETILLVDDEEMVRALGQRVLELCSYTVLMAEDGVQALEAYQAHREEIGLVVLDVIMPLMGGLECLRRLRELDPRVKVLISTGYIDRSLAQELVAEGALGVVEKPFQIRDFATAVRAALDKPQVSI